jgi:16S rRNA (uracil1498-N3)-methyltransferase
MSFIPRVFFPHGFAEGEEIELDEPTSHYLTRVLRLKEGGELIGFDSYQSVYRLRVQGMEDQRTRVRKISQEKKGSINSQRKLALAQSLPKATKFDLILRQGTELGIHRFIPVMTQRSVSRPELEQFDHKRDRWEKIIVEACRQSGRNDLPGLDPILNWNQLLDLFPDFNLVLMPYEKEAPTLRTVFESQPSCEKILVLIGPEGGWSSEEIRQARDRGALAVHLPTPILRTETAGMVVISMIQYETGD